jgi:hypothetical protein
MKYLKTYEKSWFGKSKKEIEEEKQIKEFNDFKLKTDEIMKQFSPIKCYVDDPFSPSHSNINYEFSIVLSDYEKEVEGIDIIKRASVRVIFYNDRKVYAQLYSYHQTFDKKQIYIDIIGNDIGSLKKRIKHDLDKYIIETLNMLVKNTRIGIDNLNKFKKLKATSKEYFYDLMDISQDYKSHEMENDVLSFTFTIKGIGIIHQSKTAYHKWAPVSYKNSSLLINNKFAKVFGCLSEAYPRLKEDFPNIKMKVTISDDNLNIDLSFYDLN